MKEYFKVQLDYYPTLTQDVLDKAEFKTVWSGKRMQPGDKVVYAYVYLLNTDDLKAITFLERELDEISNKFRFIKLENDIMPILVFKEDTKKRDING
jgi:hypothetical protein